MYGMLVVYLIVVSLSDQDQQWVVCGEWGEIMSELYSNSMASLKGESIPPGTKIKITPLLYTSSLHIHSTMPHGVYSLVPRPSYSGTPSTSAAEFKGLGTRLIII